MQGESGELFSSVKDTFFNFSFAPITVGYHHTTEMHRFNSHTTDVESSPCVRTTTCCFVYKHLVKFP